MIIDVLNRKITLTIKITKMGQEQLFQVLDDDISLEDWVTKKLKYKNKTINIATLFSGIGAIEYAFKRLKLNKNIVFACDIYNFCKESYFEDF